MNTNVRYEFKLLTASYAKEFVEKKFTPGRDSGDWSMRDSRDGTHLYLSQAQRLF